MISAIFGGMPLLLLAASLYWAFRRRPGQRPAGTLSLSAFLGCFAIAFSAYQPAIRTLEDSITPDFSRLVSNTATLSAAASVSSVLLFLNHDASEARRRLRWRLRLLGLAVATMAVAFMVTSRSLMWSAAELRGKLDEAPASLHIYSAAYIAFLGYAVYDCLTQTWARSRTATRKSQRIGLRTTALGCVFALLYAAYKTINAVAALFGWDAIPGGQRCTSLISPVSCAFGVTAPAVGVLLITAGLTLPAALWPLTQFLRRRWERKSIADLDPLWQDFTAALPEIVLDDDTIGENDADFLLHRRVVEINDGILTLRPYRSLTVQQAATREVERRNLAGTADGDAAVEAAILAAAIRAMRAGAEPEFARAPQAPGTAARAGDLRAETIWLRSVARAYAASDIVRTASREAPMLETAQG
ncbi:MAB_1171c family putative transporter [Kitasatospora sp. NPDC049285]|uniref:MAB_1171c family putative transporter n=1 Tax=Kitasatospora sp. NPDC049285 TaxID=3157096 RepID=UPI003445F8B5